MEVKLKPWSIISFNLSSCPVHIHMQRIGKDRQYCLLVIHSSTGTYKEGRLTSVVFLHSTATLLNSYETNCFRQRNHGFATGLHDSHI